MAKQIFRMSLLAFSGAPTSGGIITGNETLTEILTEYELFDDGTKERLVTINNKYARQISLLLSGSTTIQDQWDAAIAQIKSDESIV